MWTPKNRKKYDRSHLRYESELTDEEWAEVAPSIPPAKPGRNKRTVDIRQVMNGVMDILSTGCQWRALPKDLPPRSTVHDYLVRWSSDGTLNHLHHALYVKCRGHSYSDELTLSGIAASERLRHPDWDSHECETGALAMPKPLPTIASVTSSLVVQIGCKATAAMSQCYGRKTRSDIGAHEVG